ncbi:MAG: DNA polymerase III subunit delta' [Alphaproteobacteria bacterium]|nr:DNA polymerase III subunit delta' [Alphaproteobacteria bacterium]
MSLQETESQSGGAPEPRANPILLGHERAEATLAEAARSGRLHHAWLVTGPRGIGKATLAHRFARWLLAGRAEETTQDALFADAAPAGDGLWLDPNDPLFHRIATGGHADLMVAQREYDERAKRLRSEIVAADVRKVSGFLSLTAGEGGWRVVIVDGAEDMNRHAANALLKTLEEPPSRTVLLLVSHAPGRLLPTIHSRCRKLPLKALDQATVESLLGVYRPELAPDETAQLAALGEGSIGRALELADAGGLALYGELIALIAPLPQLDTVRLHGLAEALARARPEPGTRDPFEVAAGLLGWWLARLIRARAVGRLPPELVAGEGEVMARLAAAGNLDQWVEVWEKINRLFARASSVNLDRKQVLLNAFFALARVAS